MGIKMRAKIAITFFSILVLVSFGLASNQAFAVEDGLIGTPGPPKAAPITTAAQVMITFDACPGGSLTTYSEAGATVTGVGGGMFICDFQSPDASNSVVNTESPREETRVDFPGLVSEVSVDLGDFAADADLLFVEAFNSADVLVDFESLLIASSFSGMETLTVSGPDIAYIITGARPPALNGASVAIDNIIFTLQIAVGGEMIPLDSTMVLVGGAQYTAAWMIPVIVSAIGIGIVIARKF